MKMKLSKFKGSIILLVLCALILSSAVLLEGSASAENIDPDNDGSQYFYSENTGWLNAEPSGDGGTGVQVGDSVLSGYIWAENVGWVSLSCLNTSICGTVNYGVVNNGSGVLSGYAWGENIGWINFAPTGGGVTIDLATGKFSGKAWGENIGWVSLASTGPVTFGVTTSWRPPSDTIPPVLNMPADITAEAASPIGAVVNYPLPTATDNTDPAPSVSCSPVSGSTFPLGAATVTCTATDASGNSSSDTFTVTVADTTAPVITSSQNPLPNTNGWNNTGVIVTFTATDAVSNIISCEIVALSLSSNSPVSVTLNNEGASQNISIICTDAAGNAAAAGHTVNIDKTAPAVVVTRTPSPNPSGWNNTDVTVHFSATDGLSGIQGDSFFDVFFTIEGAAGQSATHSFTDLAGNSASTSLTINLDKTPPTLTCPIEAEILAMELTGTPVNSSGIQTFLAGVSALDMNQVVSITHNAPDFFIMGQTSVTFIATDIAGNQGICQANVTVTNPPPVFNPVSDQTVNEGQALVFVSASDPNDPAGVQLAYSVAGLPQGATFDLQTGTFSYTPEYDVSTRLADSFFDVFFTVTDGTTPVSQTVHITVRNVNRPPSASTGINQLQLECAGASCPIILDGSGSTDPDSSLGTQDDIAWYRWYEGYGTPAQQLLGTGKTISATLLLGNHTVTLEVTDQSGAVGTDTLTITLDPARLSMFVLEKAEIDWPKNIGGMADVKLHGRMALPVGLLQQELIPTEFISLDLAGQSGIFVQTVNFEVKGGEGEKWEYKANPSGAGIQNLSIHWKGAKFDYKGTVHLKTEFIGLTETALSLDREGVTEPVTISVNGMTAVIDGAGTVTASVPYESDEDGEVTFTLPFELKPEMKITLTIGNQTPLTLGVGDYYTPGGGKFELKAKIDPLGLTGASRPTLLVNVALGREGFPGSAGISEGEWKKLSTKEWKAELK